MAEQGEGSCNNTDPEPMFDPDGALSRAFLLERGYCCELGCKNCPYPQSNGREPAPTGT